MRSPTSPTSTRSSTSACDAGSQLPLPRAAARSARLDPTAPRAAGRRTGGAVVPDLAARRDRPRLRGPGRDDPDRAAREAGGGAACRRRRRSCSWSRLVAAGSPRPRLRGLLQPTSNGSDAFAAGTVYLTDNDSGTRMLSLTGAKPGNSVQSCIKVTYAGTLQAAVRLYAQNVGGTIAPYINLTVTRGEGANRFGTLHRLHDDRDRRGRSTAARSRLPLALRRPGRDRRPADVGDERRPRLQVRRHARPTTRPRRARTGGNFTWEAQNT